MVEKELKEDKFKCLKQYKVRADIPGGTLAKKDHNVFQSHVTEAKTTLKLCWKSEEQLKIALKKDMGEKSQVQKNLKLFSPELKHGGKE